MINALISINVNQIEQFFDNWRYDADGNRLANDFAPYQTSPDTPAIDVYDQIHFYINMSAQGHWKLNSSGAQPMQLVNVFVADLTEFDWTDPQDPEPGIVLTVVNYIREAFPGAIQVLDCFQMNGVRHGQVLVPPVLDDNGAIVVPEQITGTPTYPPNPKADMLLYMPDDIDADGSVIGPATNYKSVNVTFGQDNRRYE